MRETPLSNCEREFLLQSIAQKKRIDGRECYDYRHTKIVFGVERGCCTVHLGNTRVLVQVSCEVTTPKQTRPSEGILFVNVELSPMAAPEFEIGRQSEYGTEITRILERCIKESRCVDTESLCIMAALKVWTVRVDIHILNHDGNLIDCASVAAIAALAHFRRPDVTVSGEEVTIHSIEDKDPIPLSVHHMPICVTFAFFEQGKYLLVDPSQREERVMDGKMVIGMNKHREICTFQLTGSMLLNRDQVLRCSNIAVVKVTEITELIQKALENDVKARQSGEKFGFAASVDIRKVTASQKMPEPINMEGMLEQAESIVENGKGAEEGSQSDEDVSSRVTVTGVGTASIGLGGPSTWDDLDEEEEEELWTEQQTIHKQQELQKHPQDTAGDVGSSSEEETVMLDDNDLGISTQRGTKTPGGQIDLMKALKKKPAQKMGKSTPTKHKKQKQKTGQKAK